MICINREVTITAEGNKALCVIQADETPQDMPMDGSVVTNLDDHTKIAAGSILYVVKSGKRYFMNETETGWNEFGVGET